MLTPEEIDRIYQVTDGLDLNRDWVVVPLVGSDAPAERVLPDGKLLVRAPGGPAFEEWIKGLRSRLEGLNLSRTARAWHRHRYRRTIPPGLPPSSGIRKYLHWQAQS